ncbi:MAG TPA: hypothetical protein VGT78_15015 [Rhizomicrobium sp.]|nr:hypothetical protein [Rhizomicrobium sp.]
MAHIYSNDRLLQKFIDLLSETDPRIRVYVYRFVDGKAIKPYLYRGQPFEKLEAYIAETFGNGAYYIMIRRGEKMLLAGDIRLLLSLNRRP